MNEAIDKKRICRVGFCLNQKKLRKSEASLAKPTVSENSNPTIRTILKNAWKGGGLADIIFSADDSGEPVDDVSFAPFDWKNDLNGPEFDVIIHKLTEDLEQDEPSEKIAALEKYLSHHPNTCLVDPLSSVKLVTSRQRSCNIIKKIEQS